MEIEEMKNSVVETSEINDNSSKKENHHLRMLRILKNKDPKVKKMEDIFKKLT